MRIIKAIPTNIITGSLGVGKTTLIKQLLKSKPRDERWAVLVNEFGEIGLDGALISAAFKQNDATDKQTVFLREIPEGCMCCASGLPMQIALNQLLSVAKPHRLLIEPTGLGHPKELLDVLRSEYYKDLVKLNTTLCLVDARKASNQKWRNHQTFIDQLEIADVILTTKSDLYGDTDVTVLKQYLQNTLAADTPIHDAINGTISEEICCLLPKKSERAMRHSSHQSPLFRVKPREKNQELSADESTNALRTANNSGDGCYSFGSAWPAHYCFNYSDVVSVFASLNVVRIKALLITNKGIFSFNGQAKEIDIVEHDEAKESKLEVIAESDLAAQRASKAITQNISFTTW